MVGRIKFASTDSMDVPAQQHGKVVLTRCHEIKMPHGSAGREVLVASQNGYIAGVRSA